MSERQARAVRRAIGALAGKVPRVDSLSDQRLHVPALQRLAPHLGKLRPWRPPSVLTVPGGDPTRKHGRTARGYSAPNKRKNK